MLRTERWTAWWVAQFFFAIGAGFSIFAILSGILAMLLCAPTVFIFWKAACYALKHSAYYKGLYEQLKMQNERNKKQTSAEP